MKALLLLLLTVATITGDGGNAPPNASSPNVITHSQKFEGGDVLLPDTHEDGSGAALLIRGDNLTIDFGGRTLRGTSETVLPDARQGTGLLVSGRNITIKNIHVHGYQIGLLARDCVGLTILDSDFSYNWKQRLHSTPEREDLSDWMSFHHNESDEWLRYGAGIYLKNCDTFTVRNCQITGGQCGLMLTRCQNGTVVGNNFSFLSGIGVGLYRSSQNRVQQNRIDWCVRGYSHGVYNRGQDSAGILVFEQSNHNTFAYNSVTHGGDGFFLWAGQTTMDTGQGGCNDNLLYGNDFSHAPTNGIELTFSRNRVLNNRVEECWHGVWGGYSWDSLFARNRFAFNACSIAIEHGQNNEILRNQFFREYEGIRLWQNPKQDPNWGYPKHHDTRSRDTRIIANNFQGIETTDITLKDTTGVTLTLNRYEGFAHRLKTEGDVNGLQQTDALPAGIVGKAYAPTMRGDGNTLLESESDTAAYEARFAAPDWTPHPKDDKDEPPLLPGGDPTPFLPKDARRGRRYILIDAWGPYDFRSPNLVRREPVPSHPEQITFEILGPPGKWKLLSQAGAQTVSATEGTVPGRLIITFPDAATATVGNLDLELEYRGAATVDYRGIVTKAGTPVPFGYRKSTLPFDWQVRWYRWTPEADPRTAPDAFAALLRGMPIKTLPHTATLDFAGNGAFAAGLPPDHYATVAEGTVTISQPGPYLLETTTDDGCRVWVDDKPVITNAWKYQGPTLYTANLNLTAGKHTLRVEHFQIDGYAALKVNLRPRD